MCDLLCFIRCLLPLPFPCNTRSRIRINSGTRRSGTSIRARIVPDSRLKNIGYVKGQNFVCRFSTGRWLFEEIGWLNIWAEEPAQVWGDTQSGITWVWILSGGRTSWAGAIHYNPAVWPTPISKTREGGHHGTDNEPSSVPSEQFGGSCSYGVSDRLAPGVCTGE